MSSAVYRALIALDAGGVPRVLATDSAHIAFEFEHCDTDAEEIGILSAKDIGPGLWLWEGSVKVVDERRHDDLYPEWVLEFEGAAQAVLDVTRTEGLAAVADLFAMRPPEDDDRESPGV